MQTTNLDFYKVSKVYGDPSSNRFIKLYLDLDKQDNLTAFNFLQKGFDSLEEKFFLLRKQILGKKIDEVMELSISDHSFINIPAIIFLDLIEEYKGGKTFEDLNREDELICRCFGISSSQIKKILKQNPDATTLEITDQTNAGGGCTSCTDEIEAIVQSFKVRPYVEFISPSKRYLEMTPVDFLIKVDDLLNKGFGEKVKIVRLRDNFLFLRKTIHSKEEIKSYLDKEFSPHFPLSLLFV